MSKSYDDIIMKRAKAVWDVMHNEAYKRGMAVQRDRTYGDGRIIVNTVGAFIKGLNKERGWDLDQNQIDLVRRYLKATGNVVVLNKIDQYKFRIFIRETWHDSLLVTEPVTKDNPSRADKISPHDAGEDREPAPVEYKCAECGSVHSSQNGLNAHMGAHRDKKAEPEAPDTGAKPLRDEDEYVVSEHQAEILLALKEMGGQVSHDHGRVSSVLQTATGLSMLSVTNTTRSLYDRGYVDREVRGKRTYRLWLTKEGKKILSDINRYRASTAVLADYLMAKEAFTAPKGSLYASLAETLGITETRVTGAIKRLTSEGKVEILREYPTAFPHGLKWIGKHVVTTNEHTERVAEQADRHEQQVKDVPVETSSVPQKAQWFSNEALANLVAERLTAPKVDKKMVKELEAVKEKVDLIRDIIKEVNAGTLTPLKALGDIEVTLNL